MIHHFDPDEWVTTMDSHVCDFHQRHPGQGYAGCTCSYSYGMRMATPEEIAEARDRRLARGCPTCGGPLRDTTPPPEPRP